MLSFPCAKKRRLRLDTILQRIESIEIPTDTMEVDLNEIDRTLEELPVDPVKRKQRSESQDSTVEDDVAIAEAINAVEKELDEVEGKKEEGGLLTPSALLMTAVVVGSIISAKLLPLFFPK